MEYNKVMRLFLLIALFSFCSMLEAQVGFPKEFLGTWNKSGINCKKRKIRNIRQDKKNVFRVNFEPRKLSFQTITKIPKIGGTCIMNLEASLMSFRKSIFKVNIDKVHCSDNCQSSCNKGILGKEKIYKYRFADKGKRQLQFERLIFSDKHFCPKGDFEVLSLKKSYQTTPNSRAKASSK